MFHRGGRTYTTLSPAEKYPGNKKNKGTKSKFKSSSAQAKHKQVDPKDAEEAVNMLLERFPNHKNVHELLAQSAQGIF